MVSSSDNALIQGLNELHDPTLRMVPTAVRIKFENVPHVRNQHRKQPYRRGFGEICDSDLAWIGQISRKTSGL